MWLSPFRPHAIFHQQKACSFRTGLNVWPVSTDEPQPSEKYREFDKFFFSFFFALTGEQNKVNCVLETTRIAARTKNGKLRGNARSNCLVIFPKVWVIYGIYFGQRPSRPNYENSSLIESKLDSCQRQTRHHHFRCNKTYVNAWKKVFGSGPKVDRSTFID